VWGHHVSISDQFASKHSLGYSIVISSAFAHSFPSNTQGKGYYVQASHA
jgi:hypothetical protein